MGIQQLLFLNNDKSYWHARVIIWQTTMRARLAKKSASWTATRPVESIQSRLRVEKLWKMSVFA